MPPQWTLFLQNIQMISSNLDGLHGSIQHIMIIDNKVEQLSSLTQATSIKLWVRHKQYLQVAGLTIIPRSTGRMTRLIWDSVSSFIQREVLKDWLLSKPFLKPYWLSLLKAKMLSLCLRIMIILCIANKVTMLSICERCG